MVGIVLGLLFWLVVAGWVAKDAASHDRPWLPWTVFVWFTSILGLVVWLVVRRRHPVVSDGSQPGVAVLGAALVALCLSTLILGSWVITFLFQVASVQGTAMGPTLNAQDWLIINKLVYRAREPRRDEIVMHYYPLDPTKTFIKRVIAQEGDTVRIVDGHVYLNYRVLNDDYVLPEFRSHDDWGPQIIPEGYYFVLGDHRNNSSDSRHWGMVPKRYVLGKVQLRWWPIGALRTF